MNGSGSDLVPFLSAVARAVAAVTADVVRRKGSRRSDLGLRLTLAVSPNDDEWPSYSDDFTTQRFAPHIQINTKNVSQLASPESSRPAPNRSKK